MPIPRQHVIFIFTHTKVLSSYADNLNIFDWIFEVGLAPADWVGRYCVLAL